VGGGGRENWLVKIAWIRTYMYKARLPDHLISKNAGQRKKEWEN